MSQGTDPLGPGTPDAPGTAPYPNPGTVGQGDVRVPALPALTSAQIAAAPTQANYNALQADVAAVHATLAGLLSTNQPGVDQGQGGVSGAPAFNQQNAAGADPLGGGTPDTP